MNEISKEQLLYMKRTRQHKQFVLFFQLFLFIFFICGQKQSEPVYLL